MPKASTGGGKKRGGASALGGDAASAAAAPPQKQKPKQAGSCTCLACGSSNRSVDWAHMHKHPKTGAMTALDDKCAACWRSYKRSFGAYLTWEQFAAHKATEQGAKEIDQAERSALEPDSRAFEVKSVQDQSALGYRVTKRYLVLNETEFTLQCGGRPHSKMPSVPQLFLQDEHSTERERVFVFEHPTNKFRELEVFSQVQVTSDRCRLHAADHNHTQQAARTFGHTADQINESTKLSLLSGTTRVPSMADYIVNFKAQKEQLAKKHREKHDKASNADMQEDDIDDLFGDGEVGVEEAAPAPKVALGVSFGQAVAGFGANARPTSAAASQSAGSVLPELPPAGAASAATPVPLAQSPAAAFEFNTPPLKRARAELLDESASAGGSAWELGSAGGNSNDNAGGKKKGHDMAYYLRVLQLDAIVRGDKLGVAEFHARALLRTHSGDEVACLPLRNHMSLVDQAKKLSPAGIREQSASNIRAALEEIVLKQGVDPPVALQGALLERRLKEIVPLAVDKAGFEAVGRLLCPWPSSAEVPKFDVLNPILSQSSFAPQERTNLFANAITTHLIVPTILKGEPGRQQLMVLTDSLLDMFEKLNDLDEDVTALYLPLVLELAEILTPMRALLSSDIRLLAESMEGLRLLEKNLGRAGSCFAAVVGQALKRAQWPAGRLSDIVKREQAIMDAAENFGGVMGSGVACSQAGDWQQEASVLADHCKHLTRCQASIPNEFIAPIEEKVGEHVEAMVQSIVAAVEAEPMANDVLRHISSCLREFSFAFPQKPCIANAESLLLAHEKSGTHDSLRQTLQNKCEATIAAGVTSDSLLASLPALTQAAKAADGVPLGEEMAEVIRRAFDACDAGAWVCQIIDDLSLFVDCMESLQAFGEAGHQLKDRATCLSHALKLRQALASADGVKANCATLAVTGDLDMHKVAAIRSCKQSMEEVKDKCTHPEQFQALLAEAQSFGDVVGKAVVDDRSNKLKIALDDVVAKIAGLARTDDGSSWKTKLVKSPSWKQYMETALETVSKLSPVEVNGSRAALAEALQEYKTQSDSFAYDPDAELALAAANTLSETKAALVTGAAVTILSAPPNDKVKFHRALQAQLKQATAKDVAPFIDDILVVQLRKATGFK